MRHKGTHFIPHAAALVVCSAFLFPASSAIAANTQTVCAESESGGSDCSLNLGNVTFAARNVDLRDNVPAYYSDHDYGTLNLPQADVVQTGNGQGIAFDPDYFSSVGYSGRTESAGGVHTVSNLSVAAAPGFVLNSVSIRYQGVLTLAGVAQVSYGALGQPSGVNLNAPGDYDFDVTSTVSAADLAAGNFPSFSWGGFATNGQPLDGSPAVTGLIVMSLDKMTVSASVTAVPEAGTLALMALGLGGIGLARTRQARAA